MINIQAVADHLAATSRGDDTALIASLLTIANSLAQRSSTRQQNQEPLRRPPPRLVAPQANRGQVSRPAVPNRILGHGLQQRQTRAPLIPRSAGASSRTSVVLHNRLGQESGEPLLEDLGDDIKAFMERYPIDPRAYEYLTTSPPKAIAQVLRDFKPPREGDADYSGLLTSFVKRVRSAHASGGGEAASSFASGRGAHGCVVSAHLLGHRGGEEFSPEMNQFIDRYPMDDRACSLLASADPAIQAKVVADFRPPREGERDYSALATAFTKRVAETLGIPLVNPTQGGVSAPGISSSASSAQAALRIELPAGGAPRDFEVAKLTLGLDDFLARYPLDERAYEYFATSSIAVQQRVLHDFRPMREGEPQYSGLFTAFVKKIRGEFGGSAEPEYGRGGCRALGGGGGAYLPVSDPEGPPLDIEGFRLRYPMDDRAFDFLCSSPREVQERVLESFVPQRPDDSDFSRPMTAYIRACRNQLLTEASSALASSSTVDDSENVSRFLSRYPCDARAQDFLQSSAPEVRLQVIRDFRPRAEGDSDYSAALTSFVRKCRNRVFESAHQAPRPYVGGGYVSNSRPPLYLPAKRPRTVF
mmetsp:Transcript_118413/g.339951  ORF Transcript_118413/g.339951 Transcript_118413/m.339951 type:complete len:588 (+) Transcript_118413:217-1980(+)